MAKTADELRGEDYIDSREIIEAQEELRQDIDAAEEAGDPYEPDDNEQALLDFDGEDYAVDWYHGATLIREDCFEDYARQFAEDIGAIPDDAGWPCTHIDWEQAASELRMDYTSVEFLGTTYYVR